MPEASRFRRYLAVALDSMIRTALSVGPIDHDHRGDTKISDLDTSRDTKIVSLHDRGSCTPSCNPKIDYPLDPSVISGGSRSYLEAVLQRFLSETWQTVRDYDPQEIGHDFWIYQADMGWGEPGDQYPDEHAREFMRVLWGMVPTRLAWYDGRVYAN